MKKKKNKGEEKQNGVNVRVIFFECRDSSLDLYWMLLLCSLTWIPGCGCRPFAERYQLDMFT